MNIWSCRFITVDDNSSKIKCWQVGDAMCLAWKALEPPTTNSTLVPFLGRKVHLSLNVCVVVAVVDCALLSVRRISGDCKDVYVQAEQSTRKPVSAAQRLARHRTPRSASRAALRVRLEPALAFLQHLLFWTERHSECFIARCCVFTLTGAYSSLSSMWITPACCCL